jgi:hypothetical protein
MRDSFITILLSLCHWDRDQDREEIPLDQTTPHFAHDLPQYRTFERGLDSADRIFVGNDWYWDAPHQTILTQLSS